MSREPGLAGFKLQDGICIADRIVRAPLEDALGLFGEPVLVARNGTATVASPPDGIVMWAEQNGDWTTLEPADSVMMGEEDKDYLAPLFEQGIAAMQGRIPDDLGEIFENPLSVASRAARELETEAIALWGSDEWIGICGGALLDASGSVVLAYNQLSVEEITRCATSRRLEMEGNEDPNDLDDILEDDERDFCFRSIDGGREERVDGDVMSVLDTFLKERNAAQPFDPLSLWDMWPPDGEIWVAVR